MVPSAEINLCKSVDDYWGDYKKYYLSFLEVVNKNPIPSCVVEHYNDLLDYTVLGGKMIRGQALIKAFEEMCATYSIVIDEEIVRIIIYYALVVETVQASFLIADDIADGGTLRRGKTCWHLLKGNSAIAINDSMHLNILSVIVADDLEKKLNKDVDNSNILRKTINVTALGQNIDTSTCMKTEEEHYEQCSLERVLVISENKTSQYTVTGPIECGIFLASLLMEKEQREMIMKNFNENVRHVCRDIGVLFQMQDDYLNIVQIQSYIENKRHSVSASPINQAKDACDISEGKATWIHHRLLYQHKDSMKMGSLETGASPYSWDEVRRAISKEEIDTIILNYGVQNKFVGIYDVYMKYGIIEESENDIKAYTTFIRAEISSVPKGYKKTLSWLIDLIDGRKL